MIDRESSLPNKAIGTGRYQAFLIRFQRQDSHASWRVTLTDTRDGSERRFATENDAFRFLLRTLSESDE